MGFPVTDLQDRGTTERLNAIFGGRTPDAHDWLEARGPAGNKFAAHFDSAFQTLGGRDALGRSFTELMREVSEHYHDIVLSYGVPDSDIEAFFAVDSFIEGIVTAYSRVPVELHCALIRSR
jgi:hypothetical protein